MFCATFFVTAHFFTPISSSPLLPPSVFYRCLSFAIKNQLYSLYVRLSYCSHKFRPWSLHSSVIFVNFDELYFHSLVFLATIDLSFLHSNFFFAVSYSISITNHNFRELPLGPDVKETYNCFVHDALTLYLLGMLWLLYLEFYGHNNPDMLTAQPVASTPILPALLATCVAVATSSPTIISCTSNVSAASRSWKSYGTGSSHSSARIRTRFVFASWHFFPYFGSFTLHRILIFLVCLCIICLLFVNCFVVLNLFLFLD